jgi:hypothetical protein
MLATRDGTYANQISDAGVSRVERWRGDDKMIDDAVEHIPTIRDW